MLSEIATHVYNNAPSSVSSAFDSRPRSHERKAGRNEETKQEKSKRMCGEAKGKNNEQRNRKMKGLDETCRRLVMDK
jgi:hypothetical protein